MNLGIDFIISTSLLLLVLVPVYYYKEELKGLLKINKNFSTFTNSIEFFMYKRYPKIKIDYSIFNNSNKEQDLESRELLVIEDILKQFYKYEYKKRLKVRLTNDPLWKNYKENSRPSSVYPIDWSRRREKSWQLQKCRCERCGKPIKLSNSYTVFVIPLAEGGTYAVENLSTICEDCKTISTSNNLKSVLPELEIYEELRKLITK